MPRPPAMRKPRPPATPEAHPPTTAKAPAGDAESRLDAVTTLHDAAVRGFASDNYSGVHPEVLAAIAAAGLTPANNNGAGQIVAAGTLDQIQVLVDAPPTKARVIPLKVAGAFHTEHMAPAVADLAAAATRLATHRANVPVVSNRDGAVVDDGAEVLSRLVSQVSNPVRWDLCMERLAELGVTGLIELPPSGTLVGLAKRGLKGVQTLAVKTPDDLEAARTMIEEHA